MKGIVGKKVGMTQVFDEETGSLTPVTVIQAGPCPVVCVRTQGADGYDAVQLAYDEVPERKLTRPERGDLQFSSGLASAGSPWVPGCAGGCWPCPSPVTKTSFSTPG